MATSKTLAPTNVTISIPAMADAPDASVFSNCVDKEADAINALNSQITTTAVSDLTLTNVASGGHVYAWKAGSVVTLTFDFTVSTAATTLTLTTLPSGYEPKGNITQLLKVLGNPSGDYYLTLDATTRELKCYSGTKTRLIGMITFVGK